MSSTLMIYATAIITMFPNDNQSDIRNSRLYQDFIKALRSNTILLLKHWSCDVTPAIQYLKSWGLNSALNKAQLTAKTCWLLAMAGFLRPSDLERVDLDATTVSSDKFLSDYRSPQGEAPRPTHR